MGAAGLRAAGDLGIVADGRHPRKESTMLTLTENAASAVKGLTTRIPDTHEGGLRIRNTDAQDASFELALVPAPDAEDAIVEVEGARVFVDPVVVDALDDRVLDATVAEDGSIRFALGVQD
jgi:iron-sulfur cluster assembly protein